MQCDICADPLISEYHCGLLAGIGDTPVNEDKGSSSTPANYMSSNFCTQKLASVCNKIHALTSFGNGESLKSNLDLDLNNNVPFKQPKVKVFVQLSMQEKHE